MEYVASVSNFSSEIGAPRRIPPHFTPPHIYRRSKHIQLNVASMVDTDLVDRRFCPWYRYQFLPESLNGRDLWAGLAEPAVPTVSIINLTLFLFNKI